MRRRFWLKFSGGVTRRRRPLFRRPRTRLATTALKHRCCAHARTGNCTHLQSRRAKHAAHRCASLRGGTGHRRPAIGRHLRDQFARLELKSEVEHGLCNEQQQWSSGDGPRTIATNVCCGVHWLRGQHQHDGATVSHQLHPSTTRAVHCGKSPCACVGCQR